MQNSKCYTHDSFFCVFFSDDLWENCNNARICLDRKFRFFATSSGVVRLYSPLFIKYLSGCVSVCVSVTGHQTLKFKQKNRIVTDIQTESELSNWNKKVNYIVELFLKMLQKTGTFYFINYGRHCSFSIEYPTKWHIKTNNVRKI